MLKYKSNQAFTTFDFITMVFSLVAIVVISEPIIKKNMQSENIVKAQKETHDLAFELLNSKNTNQLRQATFQIKPAREERGIASIEKEDTWIGNSGKDPWGNPYHFRFLRNAQGMPVQIVVWSDGPDRKSKEPPVKMSKADGLEHIEFASDDVVSSVPLR